MRYCKQTGLQLPPGAPGVAVPTLPMTPPDALEPLPPTTKNPSVAAAIHVLSTERAALAHLEQLYQTDPLAQENLVRAVNQIARSIANGAKLVICGVGKSGRIARKLEATMNSMGVQSAFLHPTEALHGDLGIVRPVSLPRLCICLAFGVCAVNECRMTLSLWSPSPAAPPNSSASSLTSRQLSP